MGSSGHATLEPLGADESFIAAIASAQACLAVHPRMRARAKPASRIGRYKILRRVSSRADAVFAAYDPIRDRHVAIEVLPGVAPLCEVEHARLAKAARALVTLNHPNLVPFHEIGRYERATLADDLGLAEPRHGAFMVTDFVAGRTLRSWMTETSRTWFEIHAAFLQLGRGLAAAHGLGIVHGALDASRVLIDARGRVRVGGFGIAAHMASPCDDDQRAFCLALREAVGEGTSGVPRQLPSILARGLDLDPTQRYPDIDALLRALRPLKPSFTPYIAAGFALGMLGVAIAMWSSSI